MSRHSRGNEAVVSRRSRRRVEEPSITEWLDSGSYGPYAADANRGLSEEPVSTELPPPYEPPPPPAYETSSGTSSYGASSYGAPSYGAESYGAPLYGAESYGAESYGTGSYGTGSYGTGSYGTSSDSGGTSSYGTPPYGTEPGGGYGAAQYPVASAEPALPAHDAGSYGGSADTGSYGGSADTGPYGGSAYTGSYGGSADTGSYGGSSYQTGSDGYGNAPASTSGGPYGTASADPAPMAYDTGNSYPAESGSAYPAADASPQSYTGSYGYYPAATPDPVPAYDTGSGYRTASEPSTYDTGSYGGSGYGTAPAEAASSYAGTYGTHAAAAADPEPSYYGGEPGAQPSFGSSYPSPAHGPYAGRSTEDSYGAHASHHAGPVSTPDSAAGGPFLAPLEYEQPADTYRSIPAVSNPNRPPPGEYGLRTAEPPMGDYLTREPLPEPPSLVPVPAPVPVRRPTTPIPSAARSRKAPKEPPLPPVNRAGRLRLRVNPIACDGHGLCAELLPEIVSLDDWGYPMPVVAEVPPELEGHAQRAAQQCPTLAIILERRQPRPR